MTLHVRTVFGSGLLVVAAGVLLMAPSPALAAGDGVTITRADVGGHPEVAIELMGSPLRDTNLPRSAFTVLDGDARVEATVERVVDDAVEVVVAMDASGSMRGPAMDAARQGAAAFISQLPASAKVAVVGFSTTPTVAHPLSTDRDEQLAAVLGLVPRGDTALHDALVLAADQFSGADVRRAIVLLSDGGDTVSRQSLDDALRAARDRDASISVVELTTGQTDRGALSRLAAETGGVLVATADPSALSPAFQTIREGLAARYVLRYSTSRSGPTTVEVRIATPSGSYRAVRDVDYPSLPAVVGDTRVASEPGFFGRPAVRLLGLAAVGLALGLASLVLFLPGHRGVDLNGDRPGRVSHPRALAGLTERAAGVAERTLDRQQRRGALEAALAQAGLTVRAGELLVLVASAVVVAGGAGLLLLGPLGVLLLGPLPVLVAKVLVDRRRRLRQAAFAEQLPDVLQLLAGSLRAGFALPQAIDVASKEAEAPAADELRRVATEVRLGRDLAESLTEAAKRVRSDDFGWVIQAIRVHREVGGDLAEVLDNVNETVRARAHLERQVRSLSAEGRMSAYVLIALPPGVAAMMAVVNRPYIAELVTTGLGLAMVAAAAALLGVGMLWLRSLVRLDY